MGTECFEKLLKCDRQKIYDRHQKEITKRSKVQFSELLAEHDTLFKSLKASESLNALTVENMTDVLEVLRKDAR